jgi:hypothetical protein
MNDNKKSTLPLALTIIGLICLIHSLLIQILWINAFNSGSTPQERTEYFAGLFPCSLNLGTIALLDAGICLIAVASSLIVLRIGNRQMRTLNVSILITGILLLLIKVWGLL